MYPPHFSPRLNFQSRNVSKNWKIPTGLLPVLPVLNSPDGKQGDFPVRIFETPGYTPRQ
jgi:hypothetical protein